LSSTGDLAKELIFFVDAHKKCKIGNCLNMPIGAGKLLLTEVFKELMFEYLIQVLQAVPYLRKLPVTF
jgi:hypothetical protein